GVERNLTAGEMLDEVLFVEERLRAESQKVDTMVLMGSGEPMMNYDNVLAFLRLIHEPYCLNMGYRNIAVSTSGIVPGIERLAEEGIPVTLSISLHAPSDTLRSMLMPINRKYGVDKVVAAGRDYALKTKRRVTYEYILIRGVNDGEKEAQSLAELLRGQLANVNLIPINPVTERSWERPPEENIQRFCRVLERLHIVATVRQEMGSDIQAACGQLRNRRMEKGDFD
ncbi:MAG: radical SAM protein, partial [Lachnospiraceae bacterium]|nr:radical SAM protein [Lachnospiraceae bacterium]